MPGWMNIIKHWQTADEDNKQIIEEEIKKQKDRKDNYENMQQHTRTKRRSHKYPPPIRKAGN